MSNQEKIKPNILLHICCIGCGAYVSRLLSEEFRVKLFFYNPNIFPELEYNKRLEEIERVAKEFKFEIIYDDYDHEAWLRKIKGLESEPEKGQRCLLCYRDRLEKTAQKAREFKLDYFTSTLTVSPYKLANEISKIGQDAEKKYSVAFCDKDFKKQDGFKKAVLLSKELNLYRQDYCGCEFSRRDKN
jgi:predicted adenine nucleotide alpha hydrolase (AANH) superfamily ATPase